MISPTTTQISNKKIEVLLTASAVVLVLLISFCSYFLASFIAPSVHTLYTINKIAEDARTHDIQTSQLEILDDWDNPIKVTRKVSDDKTHITYTASSTGEDGQEYTDDDLEVFKIGPYKAKEN